jgi:hypothetical protein
VPASSSLQLHVFPGALRVQSHEGHRASHDPPSPTRLPYHWHPRPVQAWMERSQTPLPPHEKKPLLVGQATSVVERAVARGAPALPSAPGARSPGECLPASPASTPPIAPSGPTLPVQAASAMDGPKASHRARLVRGGRCGALATRGGVGARQNGHSGSSPLTCRPQATQGSKWPTLSFPCLIRSRKSGSSSTPPG